MESVSTFTKFLLGFITIIAVSLIVTALIPPDGQEAAVDNCGAEEVC